MSAVIYNFTCNNYRPISVLSALSKIYEKCILNQLKFYFMTENILVSNQYGFSLGVPQLIA